MKLKICSNLLKYNAVVVDELVGFLSSFHGWRSSVSGISGCHPSFWHSPHLPAKFSGPRSPCADVCSSAKSSLPLQVPETLLRPLPGPTDISSCSGSLPTAAVSAGASICSCSCHLSVVFLWKSTVLTIVFVTNKPQPPQRDLRWSYSECDVPQWKVVAVCRVTVKAVLVFCSSRPIPSASEGKQGLSGCQDCKVRLTSENWAVLS